jgi:ubiquinone/menaquinone biosynthesis C-methylase UbiE
MRPKRSVGQVDPFTEDVLSHGGYLYSTNPPLSGRLAHRRMTDAVLDLVDFRGKTVIDIGCGDGVYTLEILENGRPSRLHGSDVAAAAVRLVSRDARARSITFDVASAYQLPFADNSFDVAHVRGVLHHMEFPALAIKEALRVAGQIVVVEPNGNNPGVKLLEKFSRYHIEHQEKSYSPVQLNHWVKQAGGILRKTVWIGLVPTFSPDWFAKATKLVEPYVEGIPLLRRVVCSIYIIVADRPESAHRMRL